MCYEVYNKIYNIWNFVLMKSHSIKSQFMLSRNFNIIARSLSQVLAHWKCASGKNSNLTLKGFNSVFLPFTWANTTTFLYIWYEHWKPCRYFFKLEKHGNPNKNCMVSRLRMRQAVSHWHNREAAHSLLHFIAKLFSNPSKFLL